MRVLAPVVGAFCAIMLIAFGTIGGGPSLPASDGPVPPARYAGQNGYVMVGQRRIDIADVEQWMERYVSGSRTRYFTWNAAGREPATATAHGTGEGHWFVNSYLVGFAPMRLDSPAMALPLLARKKTYSLDHVQYNGGQDVWQTSREAWIAPRGDCEDHALVLADWLIEMGLDARVVVGTHRGGGHAWVVVVDDGQQYLLEATDKRTRRRPLPRVETTRGYRPNIQFNRESFWVNNGADATRDYAGDHWDRHSRFVRTAE